MPDIVTFFVEITKPCDFSSPEFTFLANPPINSVSCIQATTYYAPDGFDQNAYVLDRSNDVWEWSHIVGPNSYFTMFALIGVGLLVGLIVGIVSLRHRQESKA
jgi:hypothetical protein